MEDYVEVIKSPDAPHLVGKRGRITHKQGAWTCVKIGDTFTNFRNSEIKIVKDPRNALRGDPP